MTRSASAPMELAAAAARDWRLLFVVDVEDDFLAAAMAAFLFFFASLAALALFFFVDIMVEQEEIR